MNNLFGYEYIYVIAEDFRKSLKKFMNVNILECKFLKFQGFIAKINFSIDYKLLLPETLEEFTTLS
jgi:hypothetical protein